MSLTTTKTSSKKVATKKTTTKKAVKKAAAKKIAAKKTTAKNGVAETVSAPLAPNRVRVRMYNVGFGDSFLLFIPDKERTRKVLIDCGVHMSGTNQQLKLKDLVKRIVEDVSEDGIPRIDVVIATHRHRDHVHGFREALWETVEVGEVWMPWTEHPTDPRAREIREIQGKIAEQLEKALKKKTDNPQKFGLKGTKLAETKQLKEFVSNSLPNAEAMQTLHEGFSVFSGRKRVERRFLPSKTRNEHSLECELLPGVVVHVMGPSRDEAIIRDMEPPKGKSYLRMVESLPADGDEKLLPFREEWVIEDAQGYNHQYHLLSERELMKVKNAGEGTEFGVAVKLEDAVNGTSLMLMFEIGKSFFLFPGDAQWGTWEAAKNDPEWRRLLEKTNFYKVGHHGSHNATPIEFVEEILKENFWGMVSLKPIKKFKEIPRKPLMEALRNKPGKIVRMDLREDSDSPEFKRVGDAKVGDVYVEVDIPI